MTKIINTLKFIIVATMWTCRNAGPLLRINYWLCLYMLKCAIKKLISCIKAIKASNKTNVTPVQ